MRHGGDQEIFFCHGGHAGTATAKSTRGFPSGLLTVDIHCHAHIAAADALVSDVLDPSCEPMLRYATEETRATNRAQMAGLQPRLTSADVRLKDMDRLGIDIQAISPSPFQYYYWADPELGRAAARTVNDGLAELVAQAPDRFVAIGTLPMQAPNLAIEELDRVVGELGFRGVQLATNVEGEELSDSRFRRLFARAEELGVMVFLHPNGFSHGDRLSRHYLINTIGNPLDTSIAVAHLILDGVLDRFPGLKICVAHGGGFIAAYPERFDHGYKARPDCRGATPTLPSDKLKSLYYDTCVFSPLQLEFLIRQYGADRIVLGTDYPYDMAEGDPLALVAAVTTLEASERARIVGLNAASLLGLSRRSPASGHSKTTTAPAGQQT